MYIYIYIWFIHYIYNIWIHIYTYTVKFLIFRTLYFASGRFENALPAKLWISKSYIWRVGGPEMPCEPITKMAISRQIYSRKRFWLVHSKALGEIYNFGKTKIPWYIEHANRRARKTLIFGTSYISRIVLARMPCLRNSIFGNLIFGKYLKNDCPTKFNFPILKYWLYMNVVSMSYVCFC